MELTNGTDLLRENASHLAKGMPIINKIKTVIAANLKLKNSADKSVLSILPNVRIIEIQIIKSLRCFLNCYWCIN